MESKANPLDLIHNQFYENEEHDRMLRCLVTFEQMIQDIPLFHKTIAKILHFIPFINCVLNQKPNGEYAWVSRDSNTTGILYTYNDYTLFYREYLSIPDVMVTPPIRVLICGDTIGFVVNNMFMDGYALKHFMAIFFDEYNHLDDPAYVSSLYSTQTRSFENFLKSLPNYSASGGANKKKNGILNSLLSSLLKPAKAIAVGMNNFNLDAGYNQYRLVFSPLDNTAAPWLNYEHLLPETVIKLKALAAKEGITVADIISAAYIRSIAKYLNAYNSPISIGRFYNARPVSTIPNYRSFSNLHVVLPNYAAVAQNCHFHETVMQINAISKRIETEHLIAKQISRPPEQIIGPTEFFQIADYGEFKSEFFTLKSNKIIYVFFTPAMRNIPYLAVATTEYQNNIYISCANFCNEKDLEIVKVILAEMLVEINCYIYAIELLGDKKYGDVTPQINNYYYENAINMYDPKLHQFIKDEVTITETTNQQQQTNINKKTTFTGVIADQYKRNESLKNAAQENQDAPNSFLSEQDFKKINNNFDDSDLIGNNFEYYSNHAASTVNDHPTNSSNIKLEDIPEIESVPSAQGDEKAANTPVNNANPNTNSQVAPTQNSAGQPNQTSPTQQGNVPPVQRNVPPPVQQSNVPPTQQGNIPPVQRNVPPPIQQSNIPPVQQNNIPNNPSAATTKYAINPNFKSKGNYQSYNWTPLQINIATKFEELTQCILFPVDDDPTSIKFHISATEFQKRKWDEVISYIEQQTKR